MQYNALCSARKHWLTSVQSFLPHAPMGFWPAHAHAHAHAHAPLLPSLHCSAICVVQPTYVCARPSPPPPPAPIMAYVQGRRGACAAGASANRGRKGRPRAGTAGVPACDVRSDRRTSAASGYGRLCLAACTPSSPLVHHTHMPCNFRAHIRLQPPTCMQGAYMHACNSDALTADLALIHRHASLPRRRLLAPARPGCPMHACMQVKLQTPPQWFNARLEFDVKRADINLWTAHNEKLLSSMVGDWAACCAA